MSQLGSCSVSGKNSKLEVTLTASFLIFTLLAYGCMVYEQFYALRYLFAEHSWNAVFMHLLFLALTSFLVYGGVLYHFTRIGYFKRVSKNQNSSEAENELLFNSDAPRLTVLVPSYKEEQKVIMQTLLSAAFQLYPRRRVVLLIDNPPVPNTSVDDYKLLSDARNLPKSLTEYFSSHKQRFAEAERQFSIRRHEASFDMAGETERLDQFLAEMESHFSGLIDSYDVHNHVDRLFLNLIYEKLKSIFSEKRSRSTAFSLEEISREYRFLVLLFDVEFDSFERKKYLNLSHAANKAMNLNSYIDLVGGHFKEERVSGGMILSRCSAEEAQLSISGTDYFITLDADSLLVPEYSVRLISSMENPANSRVGIMQTPYSAIPGAESVLEKIAGATTDIQYLIHQGFTYFNATYWVGANALIRAEALQDIKVVTEERGYEVCKYIQDHTVIEDTESSIDIAGKKWQLHNHPERLAYSATPADYGSLVIQRRRWANGGLLITPKLIQYLFRNFSLSRLSEGFFRFHYLVSIAAVNIGLLLLMLLPFGESFKSIWLPLTSLTYYILYARDLKQNGYKIMDVFRVYALNLLLIPVNLGGVFKSIEQAFTGKHIPFARTPKIEGRTAASPLYILSSYALLAQFAAGGIYSIVKGHLFLGSFSLMNAFVLLYGVVSFIGLKESVEDVRQSVSMKSPLLEDMALSTGR
jgi:cellulose synthase/poly-beta-1,6-N-acetylglucosamine synthase-like glycosyltransferase